jgi:uncharacterized protein (TIGR02266 family)
MTAAPDQNRRTDERFVIAPMYSAVVARRMEAQGDAMQGHAYDISAGGIRIELDQPLPLGERISMMLRLPGELTGFEASGEVVWVHDDQDDPGPRRMALRFADFSSPSDRQRLAAFLDKGSVRMAA